MHLKISFESVCVGGVGWGWGGGGVGWGWGGGGVGGWRVGGGGGGGVGGWRVGGGDFVKASMCSEAWRWRINVQNLDAFMQLEHVHAFNVFNGEIQAKMLTVS